MSNTHITFIMRVFVLCSTTQTLISRKVWDLLQFTLREG